MPRPIKGPVRRRRATRGYALPAVIVASFVAATLTAAFLSRVSASTRTTSDLIQRRKTFYATDGMSRIVIREVESYMMENDDPSTEQLQLTQNIPPPEIPGFTLDTYELASVGSAFDGPIPNGPFEGMHAHQKPIRLHLTARRTGTDVAAQVDLQVTLGQISMFQFIVFADDYIEVYPGPSMTLNPGRVHANGDLCMGSYNRFEIERATSASRVLASDSRCRRKTGDGFYLWDGGVYKKLTQALSSGCVGCNGTTQAWRAFAISHFKGHLKDRAHGVTPLRVPISGEPQAQAGLDAAGDTVSNNKTARFLVDPVLPTDTPDILDQKFAYKADLRIINGVWYINDGTWPGAPIWSDHPGSFATKNEEGIEGDEAKLVGQQDLATALGWPSHPTRFSPYGYDAIKGDVAGSSGAVLSYGTIFQASSSHWSPGFWAAGGQDMSYADNEGLQRAYFCGLCDRAACTVSTAVRAADEALCQGLNGAGDPVDLVGAQYLQGTRGGFIDERVKNGAGDAGKILPINFDVEAFVEALNDKSAGELGSYFLHRPFNGIVYITGTWPGSMAGLGGGHPSPWPEQGEVYDPGQASAWGAPMTQEALPAPLCSDSLGYVPGVMQIPLSGPPSDANPLNGFEPHFMVPSCDAAVSPLSYPNAVRVINASKLDPDELPEGLSIITNLPAYVVGNVNTLSDTSDGDADPWMPVLIGADALTLLSDAWRDNNAPWDGSGSWSKRVASDTVYNFEFLGGIAQTVDGDHYSGGIENYPRFLERWGGKDATIRGSFVVGFASVFQNQPWKYGGPIYEAPNRDWGFDNHLRLLANQPPGAPLLSVHSVSRLNRR